jgi:hypothetical protein
MEEQMGKLGLHGLQHLVVAYRPPAENDGAQEKATEAGIRNGAE